MSQRRETAAHVLEPGEVELGERDAFAVGHRTQNRTPGIDDLRAAVGTARRPVLAPLRRSDHEALALDRARAQQDLPVITPRGNRERRGNEQHRRAEIDERAVELRKADVVADRQAERAARKLRDDDLASGRDVRRFAQHGAGKIDVEEVDLSIPREQLAVAVDHDRSIEDPCVTGDPLGERAAREHDPVRHRAFAQKAHDLAIGKVLGVGIVITFVLNWLGSRTVVWMRRRLTGETG